jgi:hypothetical protein
MLTIGLWCAVACAGLIAYVGLDGLAKDKLNRAEVAGHAVALVVAVLALVSVLALLDGGVR